MASKQSSEMNNGKQFIKENAYLTSYERHAHTYCALKMYKSGKQTDSVTP